MGLANQERLWDALDVFEKMAMDCGWAQEDPAASAAYRKTARSDVNKAKKRLKALITKVLAERLPDSHDAQTPNTVPVSTSNTTAEAVQRKRIGWSRLAGYRVRRDR